MMWYEYSATHPPAGLWPILVQLQWNGQSRTGLRPYPRSCDHEFTSLQVESSQKKNKQTRTLQGKGWGAPVLYLVLLYQPHLKGEKIQKMRLNLIRGWGKDLQQFTREERSFRAWMFTKVNEGHTDIKTLLGPFSNRGCCGPVAFELITFAVTWPSQTDSKQVWQIFTQMCLKTK